MNRRLTVAWLVMLLAPAFLRAQSPEGPKPSEPILKRAPSQSEWTVTYHPDRQKAHETLIKAEPDQGDENDKETKRPKSLTVSKNGNLYREITVWTDGRTSEKWIADGLQVYEAKHSKRIARSILPTSQYSDNYTDYRRSDFEELEWIGKDNFVGVKDLEGRRVFEFRADATKRRLSPRELSMVLEPGSEESAADRLKAYQAQAASTPAYTAYLDIITQLPVYFDDGHAARTYQFSDSPPNDLLLPPRFQAELESWKKELNRWKPKPRP